MPHPFFSKSFFYLKINNQQQQQQNPGRWGGVIRVTVVTRGYGTEGGKRAKEGEEEILAGAWADRRTDQSKAPRGLRRPKNLSLFTISHIGGVGVVVVSRPSRMIMYMIYGQPLSTCNFTVDIGNDIEGLSLVKLFCFNLLSLKMLHGDQLTADKPVHA